MGDGGVDHGDLHQVLLSVLYAFGDSGGNFVGLAQSVTDHTVLIADYDDGSEAEVTTTLGNLGYAVDGHQSVLEFKVRGLYSFYIRICHSSLND